MKIQITTYEPMVYFWNSYTTDINPEMIQCIIKNGGFAYTYSMNTQKLYKIILKDGNIFKTDLAGFRRINKIIKQQNLDIEVISRG
jgi:hypothetical protein